ncbi:MAG: hypothetical protein BGN96_12650 [Bacteroidales bacterium 45-6]|nr:MAG: hypothetical protein BGN96_12650 [Bacteroidales bacterium 45-6]
MSITRIKLSQLRNNEHFQFHTEVKGLITDTNPVAIKLENQFPAYVALYQDEDTALKRIAKNSFSDLRADADLARDRTFSGLAAASSAALNHFDPMVTEAARHLKIVFDTYGNVARLPLNEETAAITNLLQELKGKYAPEIQTVGLGGWVNQLEADNTAYSDLVKSGRDEDAERTEIVVKEARNAIDKTYRQLVERVEALIVVEGEAAFAEFVRKLNLIVDKYSLTLAQRKGISESLAKKKETKSE